MVEVIIHTRVVKCFATGASALSGQAPLSVRLLIVSITPVLAGLVAYHNPCSQPRGGVKAGLV